MLDNSNEGYCDTMKYVHMLSSVWIW